MIKPTFILLLLTPFVLTCKVIEQRANGVTSPRQDSSFVVLLEGVIQYEHKYFCTGVIISPKYVLTTRYCIFGMDFVNVHVFANNVRDVFESQREIYRSDQFIFPDDFDGANKIDDIALIKMPDSFVLKSYITPAQLPTISLTDGTEGRTYGWGLLDYKDDNAASYKQELPLMKTTDNECKSAYPELNWLEGLQGRLCVKAVGKTNCVSDIGSPFIVNGIVYGLQSHGQIKSCDENYPNLIQDVYYHLDWIREKSNA